MQGAIIACFYIILWLTGFQEEVQHQSYSIKTLAFYNVENLFDIVNDSLTFDEDYTLEGKNNYSAEDYKVKLKKTAQVLLDIGSGATNNSPAVIGLAEIENFNVLKDLVKSLKLNYEIIHKDSPDLRGIDVALLYKDSDFLPIDQDFIQVPLWNSQGERIYTRDILYVKGILEEEVFHILVNHWPSRRGGKSKSEPFRLKASYLLRKLSEKILLETPDAKIVIMGDFNDDPNDKSIKELLKPLNTSKNTINPFYNPMLKMYKRGYNTLAFRDRLHLFDQIIISSNFKKTGAVNNQFILSKAGIFNPSYLTTQKGKYRGYPLRSFSNNHYSHGYSDHYPVYIEIIKSNPK